MPSLTGKQILIFVGSDYEDLELWYPKLRVEEAGATTVLAGLEAGVTHLGKHGYPCTSDAAVDNVDPAAFDALIIPGGWMPDKLRRDAHVLSITRHFDETGKLIATICHGPWINISAGVCKGVRMTSTPGIKDDVLNAGGEWIDEEVVIDRHHITSRRPPDLPAFGAAIVDYLSDEK